jgi:hypothetical protein
MPIEQIKNIRAAYYPKPDANAIPPTYDLNTIVLITITTAI